MCLMMCPCVRFRCNLASLLTIALHGKLEYYTSIMKDLLVDLIDASASKNPKLMLRRTESVVEKMLTNWMSICMYSYLKVCEEFSSWFDWLDCMSVLVSGGFSRTLRRRSASRSFCCCVPSSSRSTRARSTPSRGRRATRSTRSGSFEKTSKPNRR